MIRGDPRDPGATAGAAAFFDWGRREVAEIRAWAEGHQQPFGGGSALDFGCGPGRIVQALAPDFDRVVGVDVAESMLARARYYNRFGTRCEYLLNRTDNLGQFPDEAFRFVYSNHVLQHLPEPATLRYLGELVRVLAPGGLLIVQEHGGIQNPLLRSLPRPWVEAIYNRSRTGARPLYDGGKPRWEVHWIPPAAVTRHLERRGARVLEARRDPVPEGRMVSWWYYATRGASGTGAGPSA
jgi:SAM-dependent methyltransferase